MTRLREIRQEFMDVDKIGGTVERLVDEDYISLERGEQIREEMPKAMKNSEHALFNLAAHLTMGSVTLFAPLFCIPGVGIATRASWILGNRIYYEIRRDERRKIHSGKVLLASVIPWAGFLAYTIPLKQESEDLCYVYVNHITYAKKDKAFEECLEGKPGIIRVPLRKLFVPRDLYDCSGHMQESVACVGGENE